MNGEWRMKAYKGAASGRSWEATLSLMGRVAVRVLLSACGISQQMWRCCREVPGEAGFSCIRSSRGAGLCQGHAASSGCSCGMRGGEVPRSLNTNPRAEGRGLTGACFSALQAKAQQEPMAGNKVKLTWALVWDLGISSQLSM